MVEQVACVLNFRLHDEPILFVVLRLKAGLQTALNLLP
jgi:hypothetical protein